MTLGVNCKTNFADDLCVISDPVFADDFLWQQRPSFVDESHIRNDLTDFIDDLV
jgi:hypothetical protein